MYAIVNPFILKLKFVMVYQYILTNYGVYYKCIQMCACVYGSVSIIAP